MHTLLSSPVKGVLFLTLLFLLCFALVHIARLVAFGQKYRKERNAPPAEPQKTPPPEKKAPPQAEEPIYYIVERKKRTKSTYGEPKRINFK
ncbi:MAG: hypothetical protein E7381_04645 [Clostridiales bacterium]|nr:hypothetical protein [Clostridiales bacterium]